jgi:hypothetical protein
LIVVRDPIYRQDPGAPRPRGEGFVKTTVLPYEPRHRWSLTTMTTETPPDRLATNPDSPHYDEAVLARGVGVRFKGVDKNNVDEYCVSEGWVRLAVGKTLDRKGNPVTVKLQGEVEPYFRDTDG